MNAYGRRRVSSVRINEARERLEERSSVSISVKRGEKFVKDDQLALGED